MTEAELKMFDEALEKKARDLGIKMRDSKTIQNAASNILGKIKL